MRSNVRILVLGDDSVGKSSIISCLLKETFIPSLQHVLPELRIPPECTRDNIATRIIDSSARPENRDQLETEIRRADVICIVYAIDKHETFVHVSDYWLPLIRQLGKNIPIIVVGNKLDTRQLDSQDSLESLMAPIMNEFKEVELCIECSAMQGTNISETFYFAQKAVLNPTAPLYDSREHTLKPACLKALERIFVLCDKDRDSFMNISEINDFQSKCFDAPLQNQELENIREVVRSNAPDGFTEKGLTLAGFIYLNTLFVQKGKIESTWEVLRRFGYEDDLSLKASFLQPSINVGPLDAVELSSDGIQFFTDLFRSCDRDSDGALNALEMQELFQTAPSHPWISTNLEDTAVTDHKGAVTLQGFLALLSMTTLLSYQTTLAYLAYLGHEDTPSALKILKNRHLNPTKRNVFLCYVFGATGSGKTSFMKGLIGQKFSETYKPTVSEYSVVNSVEVRGVEKDLVMQEYGPQFDSEVLQNTKKLQSCDVLCFVYDSSDPNSFAYVANLWNRYKIGNLPCVFIATKSDLDLAPQRYEVQPDIYCRSLGITAPFSVSLKESVTADVYRLLVGVAMKPDISMVGKKFRTKNGILKVGAITAVSVVVVAVLVAVGYRMMHPEALMNTNSTLETNLHVSQSFENDKIIQDFNQKLSLQNKIQDISFARELDSQSSVNLRDEFEIPRSSSTNQELIYMCGNSLGLLPVKTKELINQELQVWGSKGVYGHFDHPFDRAWVTIDDHVIKQSAIIVGAKEHEVAIMNSLTANLHLLMVSFYRPTKTRYKILMESHSFPSDYYAMESQVKFHGFDPSDAIIELSPSKGKYNLETVDILDAISKNGDSIALILFSGVQYYTGQFFDISAITKHGHKNGCIVGFDLAHAVGNVPLQLHDWDVDFACWCTYKYLNAGPGGIGGAYINEKFHNDLEIPRFNGWWGTDPITKFNMDNVFRPIKGTNAYRLSNPNVLATVSLLGSLNIFEKTDMKSLRQKSLKLTRYLEKLLSTLPKFKIITPSDPNSRGCQLSLLFEPGLMMGVFEYLVQNNVICDERKPDVIRIAPTPLYNTFEEVYVLFTLIKKAVENTNKEL